MDSNTPKTNNDSCISTTGTPASQRYSDNTDNVKYINLNFVDNSESSNLAKEALTDYQNNNNSNQDQPIVNKSTAPNKILPSSLPLNGLDKRPKKSEHQLTSMKEKSLFEMGYKANEVKGWENITQPKKEDLYKLLKNMIENHIKPNVQIRIGEITFNCHLLVLQCYSEFFMECSNEILIKLPEEKISPSAFMMVYDWMLSSEPLVQREGILELFNAANFLRIKGLINQCWLCLDDDCLFREDTAFILYLEARQSDLESLKDLMLMRICKFFLTLVSSKEFLMLNAREICTLLSSNTIGVNSEIEIFMSAIRWLSHDWSERQHYMLDVVECVRFSLMPPWFLVTLNKNTDCSEINRITDHSEVRKMINDAITYTTTQLYYRENRDEFIQFLERYQLTAPLQRQWIYDKECNYHHRLQCPNMQFVTYTSFLEYLEMLRTTGKEYWRSLEIDACAEKCMNYACLCTEFRKPNESNIAIINTKTSRDRGVQCVYMEKNYKRKGIRKIKLNHKNNSCNKSSIRRMPPGRHKYNMSSSQTKNTTNNDDITTEAETTIDFKYPPASDVNLNIHTEIQKQHYNDEKRQIQPETTVSDDKKQHQTDIQQQKQYEQQPTNQHDINDITFINSSTHTTANVIINDSVTTKWQHNTQHQQKKHHQHLPETYKSKQLEHLELQQQVQCNNQHATDICGTVTYKHADGLIPDDTDDCILEQQQQQQQNHLQKQYSIDDNHDFVLMKHNVATGLVKEDTVDNTFKDNNSLKSGTKQRNSTIDLTRNSNHKILLFGGIDPFCFRNKHMQQNYQQQKQQQKLQQKKQLLQCQRQHYYHQQLLLQRKHIFSIGGTHINSPIATHSHPLYAAFTDASIHNHHYHHNIANAAATDIIANKSFENNGDQVLVYDIDDMEWRHFSYIPFGSLHHHAVVACNGLIYVIGGTRKSLSCPKKSIFEKTVWCFNPRTIKWTLETNLPESRRDFAVIAVDEKVLANNKSLKHDEGFYVIGGEGVNGKALSSVWFYNVKRKIWTKKPSLNIGRYGLAAVMVNNEIWVAGGICGNNDNTSEILKSTTAHVITDTVEIYNLTHTHKILAKQQHHTQGFLYQKYNDDGSGEGGGKENKVDDSHPVNESYFNNIKLLPNSSGGTKLDDGERTGVSCNVNQWFQTQMHLRIPRVFGKFCKMSNNDLYLVGGIGYKDLELQHEFISLSDIDIFNMDKQKWEHIGDLNLARHGHDVGHLNDHCIVVIGGVSTQENCCLNNVEAFCTKTRKSLKNLTDLPWPLSGCGVVTIS